jgi:large subunit ribosomal protein L13
MSIKLFKTFVMKKRNKSDQQWYLINAEGQIMGRLAVQVANLLRGKQKAEFTPNLDSGDFVIVTNIEKAIFKGNNKMKNEKYYHHTSFANGLKEETLESLFQRAPEKVLQLAVNGMLPKNKMRDKLITKLKVYKGSEHPHKAQKVIVL